MSENQDQRKRANSEGTGESPEAKKMDHRGSPEVLCPRFKRVETPIVDRPSVERPSDSASALEWCKATYSKMDDMWALMCSVKDSLNFHIDELTKIDKKVVELTQTVGELKGEVTSLKSENMQLKIQCKKITEEIIRNEVQRREMNLIFDGISDTHKEGSGMLYDKFVSVLNHMEVFAGCGRQVPLAKLHRIGHNQSGRNRSVLCRFLKFSDIQLIMQNREQLPNDVYVRCDYPAEIEDRRRLLRPILNNARRMDKYRGKCRLTVDKLVIDSQVFTVAPINNLNKLPAELNPRKVAERENESTLAFFTQSSPFSNFHKAPFTTDGVKYSCCEQYIQSQKALIFDDENTLGKIMKCDSPYEMKQLGNNVKNFTLQLWHKEAEKVAYAGCWDKFSQNPELKEILLSTLNKTLIEASRDLFWGVGMSLNDKNVLHKESWTGKNTLGNVLMLVRQRLLGQ